MRIQVPSNQFEVHKVAKAAIEAGWTATDGSGHWGNVGTNVTAPNGRSWEWGEGVGQPEPRIEDIFGIDEDVVSEETWENCVSVIDKIWEMSESRMASST